VQEAFAVAAREWPVKGIPPNPGGWIMTTARNRAIDRKRKDVRGRQLLGDMASVTAMAVDGSPVEEEGALDDERLRLIFTCCHPALSSEAQIALTLRLLGGLATEEVARSFLVTESTMTRRLVRAKSKIKAARVPYRVPADDELPERLRSVLAVVYLIYNAGSSRAEAPDLCYEAIRLARILGSLMPEEEVAGLLALLLLTESRRSSRRRLDGSLVLLKDQDRASWDRDLIDEGQAILRRLLRRDRPGPYQLQAAINAVHADATTFDETDWPQIATLYEHLFSVSPTPVVALNRAVAIGEVEGPVAGLALVDQLGLEGYYAFHAVRADLLRRAGRRDEAEEAYRRAASLAPTQAEREVLESGGRASQEMGG
jgi:RNA polymerase sigma-70 factor, ECF subfamily